MHDLMWFLVFGAILATPFLPAFLKSKCPSCSKRKLDSLGTLRIASDSEESGHTFVTTYRCNQCREYFKRVKSGEYQKSSADEHEGLVASASS